MEEKDRQELFDTWKSSVEAFDKIILTISSGAFAIALAFTDKIVKFSEADYNLIFVLSLLLFAFGVLLSMWNYFREINVINKLTSMKQELDTNDKAKTEELNKQIIIFSDAANKKGNVFRKIQIAIIVFGASLLFAYIFINSYKTF